MKPPHTTNRSTVIAQLLSPSPVSFFLWHQVGNTEVDDQGLCMMHASAFITTVIFRYLASNCRKLSGETGG